MKRNNFKSLIREEVQKVRLQILEENIISDIISLILTPKVKKSMKALKADPEFKELERQAKLAKEELEAITKRIEKNLDAREQVIQDMKKAGVKVDTSMDAFEVNKAYQNWSKKLLNQAKKQVSRTDWESYFGKK